MVKRGVYMGKMGAHVWVKKKRGVWVKKGHVYEWSEGSKKRRAGRAWQGHVGGGGKA